MKRLAAIFLGLFLTLTPSAAFANAVLATDPASGTTISVTPNTVSVTTSSSLIDQGNTLTVSDSMGNRVDDGSITINDVTAIVGMKNLTSTGVYTVNYTLFAQNDDPISGTYTFTYNAPVAVTSPTATPSSTSAEVVPTANNSTDTLIYGLLVAAVAVFLLLIWYAIRLVQGGKKQRKRK
ncbi:MAG: copper resistance protein CopC [Actinomycetes bacterium]